jgi:hypothetical protein
MLGYLVGYLEGYMDASKGSRAVLRNPDGVHERSRVVQGFDGLSEGYMDATEWSWEKPWCSV